MKQVFLCLVFFSAVVQVFPQKSSFYMIPQLALINGDHYADGAVLLSAGVETKTFQYGLSTGFDYYRFRSVPLYADVKKLFKKDGKKPFIYAGAGWNIAYPLRDEYTTHYTGWGWGGTYEESKFSNGFIAEGGAGIILPNKKGKGFVLSLGYSTKTLKEAWTESVWNPVSSAILLTPRSDKYTLNRVILKAGFRLF